MGTISIHNTVSSWFVRAAGRAALIRPPAQERTFDAEELRRFHQALRTAYRIFASQHPEWTRRGFDLSFLREDALNPLLICWVSDNATQSTPTGMDLARIWERKFGLLLCGADRVRQVVRLADAASGLLAALESTRR